MLTTHCIRRGGCSENRISFLTKGTVRHEWIWMVLFLYLTLIVDYRTESESVTNSGEFDLSSDSLLTSAMVLASGQSKHPQCWLKGMTHQFAMKKALKIDQLRTQQWLTTLVLAYLVPASTLTQRHDSPICEKKALKMDLSTDSLLAFTLVLASAVVAASMLIQSSPIQLEVDSPFSPFHFSIETVTSYLFNCWTNVDNFSCNQTYDAVSLTSSMKYHGQHSFARAC